MRRLLPLLISVIVTPLSAAAQSEAMLAQASNESETAEVVEVFQGGHVLVLTEGINAAGGSYQSDFLNNSSIPIKSLEGCIAAPAQAEA